MTDDVDRLLALLHRRAAMAGATSIERLVRCESPSTDKAAVDRLRPTWSAPSLPRLAHASNACRSRASAIIVRAEVGDGRTQVLLLGHFDTVWPVGQLDRMPLRAEAGRLYGPGVFDMKAGIALAMLALRALGQLGLRAAAPTS